MKLSYGNKIITIDSKPTNWEDLEYDDNIPNCFSPVAWYLMCDENNLTYSSGNMICKIDDLSGNDNYLCQSATTNQSCYANGGIEVCYNSNNEYYTFNNNINTCDFDVFAVKQNFAFNTENCAEYPYILWGSGGTETAGLVTAACYVCTTYSGASIIRYGTALSCVQLPNLNTNKSIFEWYVSGGTTTAGVSDGVESDTDTGGCTMTTNNTFCQYSRCHDTVGYLKNIGRTYELIIYDKVLSDDERTCICNYLKNKHNLS